MDFKQEVKVDFPIKKPVKIIGQPKNKAWVLTVDMGYGHQRTAYPLRDISLSREIINANSYDTIPAKDKRIWKAARSSYEFISRFRRVPIIGLTLFLFMDRFQKIFAYYPKRDMSKPTIAGRLNYASIKKGWGKDLIDKLKVNPAPIVSTFFIPAFMADQMDYPNDIYCVICDADIARNWVRRYPKKSKIKYFASNTWTRDRLKLYGVNPQNITLTGYPLPKELIGPNMEILKRDLGYRILNLDPRGEYRNLYAPLIKEHLGQLPALPNHPLTLMFCIGGAGAQKEIAMAILNSLKEQIKAQKIKFVISVGVRKELALYFEKRLTGLELDGWAHILYGENIKDYFEKFNKALKTTDILMTKPSELSFYAGLGIPIIIQPSIGSQEDFNRRWLLHIGCATLQENPKYAKEWIYDLLESGHFAEMAMQGFVEIDKMGTYNIEKIIKDKSNENAI